MGNADEILVFIDILTNTTLDAKVSKSAVAYAEFFFFGRGG
jgi:hypothetical protein